MKNVFKPIGVAAAVAAASAGYVNVANAQATPVVANNNLGDLALVPYYTVKDNWITGIHIVNTSDRTQVVKMRFRRALDSLDALDFNVIMSPQDVYAGGIRKDAETGDVFWSANDSTCTSPPSGPGVRLGMPSIYNEDGMGETGYVEIIGMGSPLAETYPIAEQAVHAGATATVVGVPGDCVAVDAAFEADGDSITNPGVVDGDTAWSPASPDTAGANGKAGGANQFEDTGNVLKVSYFMRDRDSGVEFGDNAVHIQNFLETASITNQEFGWLSGDLNGFDFPDINGTTPVSSTDATPYTPVRDRFNLLRDPSVLGVGQLINEWAANGDNVNSWIVTLPGQYTMMDTPEYVTAYYDDDDTTVCTSANDCDFRDIPVNVTVTPYDREEKLGIITTDGSTVVSPSVPGEPTVTRLEKEVNIVTFAGNSVLGEGDNDINAPVPQPFGWAALQVTPATDPRICTWDELQDEDTSATGGVRISAAELELLMECDSANSATGNVPMIGFAAWARQPAGAAPGETYGRIVEHSFTSSAP